MISESRRRLKHRAIALQPFLRRSPGSPGCRYAQSQSAPSSTPPRSAAHSAAPNHPSSSSAYARSPYAPAACASTSSVKISDTSPMPLMSFTFCPSAVAIPADSCPRCCNAVQPPVRQARRIRMVVNRHHPALFAQLVERRRVVLSITSIEVILEQRRVRSFMPSPPPPQAAIPVPSRTRFLSSASGASTSPSSNRNNQPVSASGSDVLERRSIPISSLSDLFDSLRQPADRVARYDAR